MVEYSGSEFVHCLNDCLTARHRYVSLFPLVPRWSAALTFPCLIEAVLTPAERALHYFID